ncbi:MAG: sulfite exporter TauE/SafE family protein [Gemmatimonadetes bacterium]|nr:sulfite exporter TauE/SafE family protein [Gemmatimonadota bacterium]
MAAELVLALVGGGLAVGVLAGLVGIGGGVLMVPLLYFFYGHVERGGAELLPALQVPVAHATSLFIIVPTAIWGTVAYHRHRLVAWRIALPMAAASAAAAVLGTRLALLLPASALKAAFGALLLGLAADLLHRQHGALAPAAVRPGLTVLAGVLVGLLSALLGVGGGLIAIPLLVYVVRLELPRVTATSLAIVAFAAAAGALGYIVQGWNVPELPPENLGYVDPLVALLMLVGSLPAVRWGTALNRRLQPRALRAAFALLFTLLGLELIVENLAALL